MAKYVTVDDVNSYLGISGNDTLIASLILGAEALFDTLTGGTGIESKSHTDDIKLGYSDCSYDEGRVFYLSAINITALTSINGVSQGTIDVDYIVKLQKVELKNYVEVPSTFPYRYRVVYTAGYGTIPDDVKLVVKMLVGAMYSTRNANGVASFRQDLLSVNFKDASILDTLVDPETKGTIQAVANKYKVYSVIG